MTDSESLHLVNAAQGGDATALDELLRRHLPDLRAFVRAKSGQVIRERESCSDLVQTVCREVLGGLEGYEWRGEGSFRHWLFTVALNKIRGRADYYAAQRRDSRREVGDDALAGVYATMCGPSQHAIAAEAVANFESGLDRLAEDHRDVVLMSRVVGLSHAEIADELGIEVGAVRTRLSRALTRLATIMAGPPPE
ncbi:MAG: RNA polymerase sigma factor [bacterium]|nr:RNA polymerase sigma factor [bacterium]